MRMLLILPHWTGTRLVYVRYKQLYSDTVDDVHSVNSSVDVKKEEKKKQISVC